MFCFTDTLVLLGIHREPRKKIASAEHWLWWYLQHSRNVGETEQDFLRVHMYIILSSFSCCCFFFFVALNVNKFLISFVVVIIFINLIYPCQIDVVCLFKLAFLSLSLPSTHICLLPVSYVVYISNFNFQASVSVLYTRFISHYLHISESFLSVFPDLISNVILFTRFHCMFISS